MPVFRITSPDGTVYRVTAPEGATEQDALARVQAQHKTESQMSLDPTAGNSFLQNTAIGAGKAVADVGRGLGQRVRSVIPEKIADVMGLPTKVDVAEARSRDAPLMDTAGGKVGNVSGSLAMFVPTATIPGANTATGAALTGAAMGFTKPTVEGESVALNTATNAAFGVGGKIAGDKLAGVIGNRFANKTSELATREAQDASRNATLASGREAGYVVPPTQANAQSAWNQILEGFSGKIKTGQAASFKNQEVTNRLAREALGLPADAPITKDALTTIRQEAGRAYEALSAGRYATDPTFRNRLQSLADGQTTMAKELPELANKEVLNLVESLNQPSFDGRTVVELTKMLRDKSTAAFRAGETGTGRFYRDTAREAEDLIERNLMSSGQEQLLSAFRNARTTIAKAHTVESALNDATGNVNAQKLGALLKKGKTLSGGLKTAGEFAEAFPKAAQQVEKSGALATSPLDWAAMGMIGAATANPLALAGVAARPATRAMLLSDMYQNTMAKPNYSMGATTKALPTVGAMMRRGQVLAPVGYQSLND